MNEIKIGKWARGYSRGEKKYVVGKITKISNLGLIKLDDDFWIFQNDLKSADNLVDLLEVGDIITLKWHDGLDLENEYILTESLLKNLKSIYVYGESYEIAAIELHENRVKQVIGDE